MTHRNGAGWWIDLADMRCFPATPQQYLRRLELVNELFDDDVRLEGIDIGPGENDCRVITSQPQLLGDAPPHAYLMEWLTSWGFEHVRGHQIGAYDAACFCRGDLWLFDVRPANFVLGDEGHCFPLDVIVQRESERDL